MGKGGGGKGGASGGKGGKGGAKGGADASGEWIMINVHIRFLLFLIFMYTLLANFVLSLNRGTFYDKIIFF